ncbi:hypothetical protein NE237_027624 [Protea cynaroides]|uniref:Uncharacterized protein n=1 Tax=Protea cynaroides TaxID=273540 RepID=A0A9Q0JTC6_9MAGN|nr:hypothetical protein NE237_027624 [Protea cynaroides]
MQIAKARDVLATSPLGTPREGEGIRVPPSGAEGSSTSSSAHRDGRLDKCVGLRGRSRPLGQGADPEKGRRPDRTKRALPFVPEFRLTLADSASKSTRLARTLVAKAHLPKGIKYKSILSYQELV